LTSPHFIDRIYCGFFLNEHPSKKKENKFGEKYGTASSRQSGEKLIMKL